MVVGSGDSERIVWRTSSASGGGECVEVAFAGRAVLVRDSRDRSGPVVPFAPQAWRTFVTWIRSGGNGVS